MLKFNLIEGRSEEQLRSLMDTTHEAMLEAFQVPVRDRYQCVTQDRPGELILEDTGLGYPRTRDVVLLTVISRPRAPEQKTAFYRLLSDKLQAACGLSQDDLIVSLADNTDADWSFGHGRAQFLIGEF